MLEKTAVLLRWPGRAFLLPLREMQDDELFVQRREIESAARLFKRFWIVPVLFGEPFHRPAKWLALRDNGLNTA